MDLYFNYAFDLLENKNKIRTNNMKKIPIIGLLNKIQIPNCNNDNDYNNFKKYCIVGNIDNEQLIKLNSIKEKIKNELRKDKDCVNHIFEVKNELMFKENNFYCDINNKIKQLSNDLCTNVKFILSDIILDEDLVSRDIILKYISIFIKKLFYFDETKLIINDLDADFINSKIIKEWKKQNKCILCFLKETQKLTPDIIIKLKNVLNKFKIIILESEDSLYRDYILYTYVDAHLQFSISLDDKIVKLIKSNLKYSTIFNI